MDKSEKADHLAREAVDNSAIRINTPPSWAAYKQAKKTQLYEEWNNVGPIIMLTE